MTENPRVYPFKRDDLYQFISFDDPVRAVSWMGTRAENLISHRNQLELPQVPLICHGVLPPRS